MIEEKCARAGLIFDRDVVLADHSALPLIEADPSLTMIITMGDYSLTKVTGQKSIWKWHLSPLDTLPQFACKKVVPTFSFEQMQKEWHLGLYIEMAFKRAAKAAGSNEIWKRKQENYLLDPPLEQTIATLESLHDKEWLSLDIETGRGQINTFGVAWSESDAIAIKLLPDNMPTNVHHKIWSEIAKLCESDQKKVMQGGIYEQLYLSRYGILVNNFAHDTMMAMRLLYPELEKGLDNVARIYTMEPYWKDDGRVVSAEGKQRDWDNIRDWDKHLNYNCKDTSNTLIAALAQRRDLESRGQLHLYDNYVRALFEPVYEMCAIGLPLNCAKQAELVAAYEAKSASLVAQLSKEINPRSSKQKMELLKAKGYELPRKRGKKDKPGKESADELSLKKLRLKHPEDKDLQLLIEVAKIDKALSSYLRVKTLDDKRIRFMLYPTGTETLRMSCMKDVWGGGFNAQTLTEYVKQMIEWPASEDRNFIEIDLRQAESRFVAFDAAEENLLRMLVNDEDIHSYVATEIFKKSMAEVLADSRRTDIPKTQTMRQLGKKSGHGANYSVGANTFVDSCLKEMDLVITKSRATDTLDAYHRLFPGIRRWHLRIRETIYRERKLSNPFGAIRHFYGRMDDNTFREGYAYRPQSTVPYIINSLMLKLKDQRTAGACDFQLHCQSHDSILLSCKPAENERIAKFAFDYDRWHPNIILTAGKLVIPVEIKWGKNLGQVKELRM